LSKPTLETAAGQFELVCPAGEDLEGLDALLNDPVVAGWLGGTRTRAAIKATIEKEFAHWRKHRFGPYVLVRAETREVVGRGGLRRTEVLGKEEVELFYAVKPMLWGAGLASFIVCEALNQGFREHGLQSVVVFTIPRNAASLRVIEKFGFGRESDFEHAGLPHVLFRLHREAWHDRKLGERTPP
jgi:RimJ/RimL family protein N-acetyltransferase